STAPVPRQRGGMGEPRVPGLDGVRRGAARRRADPTRGRALLGRSARDRLNAFCHGVLAAERSGYWALSTALREESTMTWSAGPKVTTALLSGFSTISSRRPGGPTRR